MCNETKDVCLQLATFVLKSFSLSSEKSYESAHWIVSAPDGKGCLGWFGFLHGDIVVALHWSRLIQIEGS